MFDRLQRSWDLTRECFKLLAADRSLLVFPLLSAISMTLIIASFALPLYPVVRLYSQQGYAQTLSSLAYAGMFAFYWLQFSIVIFFQTALIEVAMRRFDGQPATISDGIARAWSRLPVILSYALVAATVGTILRIIAERVGFLGRIVVGLIGFGWAVATALVAPVLAAESVGPLEAISRSGELIRRSWGEQVIGSAGIGLVFGVASMAVAALGVLVMFPAFRHGHWMIAGLLLVVVVASLIAIILAQSTLQGIYAAALYRYATGDTTGSIDRGVLERAFTAKD